MFARSIPNYLGLFRILATPGLMWLILVGQPDADLWAAALLLIIAISDIVDGPLARRMQVVSPLGIFLDTSSDKVFIAGALIPLVERGIVSSWIVMAIIGRDFLISALRSYAAAEGHIISARTWGKQKLILITTAIIWQLLRENAHAGGVLAGAGGWFVWLLDRSPWVWTLALIWTVLSGAEYLRGAWPLLQRGWSPSVQPARTEQPAGQRANRS